MRGGGAGFGRALATARVAAAVAALLYPACLLAGEPTGPPWLREAAAATLTPTQASAPAVVLLDERTVTVSSDGVVRTRHVYAARIGTHEGRDAASLSEVYLTDGGKVRQARGWIIRPGGQVREIDKDTVLDLALAGNDVYNESRMRVVQVTDPEPGTVFGAEIVSEQRSVFTQLQWEMQDRWPVRTVRRTLTLPPGWRAVSTTFNHEAVEPAVSGATSAWQLEGLPAVNDEPAAPPWTSLVPRIAVSYFPDRPDGSLPGFTDWKEVSRWLDAISAGEAGPDAALTAKARELTASASTEFERVRAIGEYVQRVTYISIQIGLGRGGGYRPRPAALVFARNHGDCKDKANLMRAMLAAVGIRSYLVSAFLGDRGYVREEWPSPQQFNHCILAVVLAEPAPAGLADLASAAHGRLLVVDPTAETTPIGTLPRSEEGSLALIEAPDGGELLRLPDAAPGAHRVERTVDATIDAGGALVATVRESRRGQPASAERAAAEGLAAGEYRQRLERWVSGEIPAARISDLADRQDQGAFDLSMKVAAAGYAKLMQGRLLVLTPPFALTDALPETEGQARTQPVMVEAGEWADTLRVEPPAGFELDELPEAASIEAPFGRYTLSARQEGGRITVERRLALTRAIVPPADYAAVRAFVGKARAADSSPIVFRRR